MQSTKPAPPILAPPRWAIPLLLAVFALGLGFILPRYTAYYFGDEHFYTDGALRMIRTGDTLTPVYPDGTPRFNKPVLTYWMILGGFRLFGISVAASRLPSLAAGLLLLLLTHRMARRLFKSESAAWLALLIAASNIQLITASLRATPDIFLALFSLLALYGFAGLLFEEKPSAADCWFAYAGAGLAVAAKGLLGVLLLGFILALALAGADRAARLRRLVRPLPMLAGFLLAAGWFIAVWHRHGDAALHGFFNDQVGSRLDSPLASVLPNLFRHTAGLVMPFFPWSILLLGALAGARPALAAAWRAQGRAFLFVFAWYGLLLLVFAPANFTRTRFLLPAYPLLAAAFAVLLQAALEKPALERLARGTLRFLLVAMAVAALLLFTAALLLDRSRLALAGAVLLTAALGLALPFRPSPAGIPLRLALGLFLAIWTGHVLVRPAFPTTPAYAILRTLRKEGANRLFYPAREPAEGERESSRYKEKFASQLRLASGATLQIRRLSFDDYLARDSPLPILCFGADRDRFPPDRFRAVRAGSLGSEIEPAEAWALLRGRSFKAGLRAFLTPCYVIFPVREPPPAERTPPP